MRLLFLTPQLPYPLVSGGVFKSFRMISFLSEHYDIKLGCLLKNNDQASLEEYIQKVKLKDSCFENISSERNIKTFLASILDGIPLSVFRNKSSTFKQKIQDMSKDVDVIFVDHFLMFQYIPESFSGKIIYHAHNAEHIMWARYAQENNFFKRMVLNFEAGRIKKYEIKIIDRSTHVFAAPNDIEEFKKIAPRGNYHVTYHLGDDTLLNEPHIEFNKRENILLYIGTLTWEANRDGLHWFLKNTWSNIKKELPGVKLVIIGKTIPDDFCQWVEDTQISCVGFVQDLTPYYSAAKVFISPLRFGSGVKVKNVNAMYRGLPIVTTSIGAEGLDLEDENNIMIADDSAGFQNKIQKLVRDQKIWSKISNESRKFALAKLSWNAILEDIKKVVDGC